jgi:hypothetical protein
MSKRRREKIGEFWVRGAVGAFLAALIAISVQFWWHDINWIFVAVAAVFGFLLGGIAGDDALDFLKQIWWWT